MAANAHRLQREFGDHPIALEGLFSGLHENGNWHDRVGIRPKHHSPGVGQFDLDQCAKAAFTIHIP